MKLVLLTDSALLLLLSDSSPKLQPDFSFLVLIVCDVSHLMWDNLKLFEKKKLHLEETN